MDSLSGISMFVLVAETRSFTKAGQQFGVSSSAVGKSIARMEERLAVRLFHRSTRSITLTAEGALFLERCRRILGEVEAAEAELSEVAGAPRGRLRVSTPQLTGLVMPALDAFMQQYPDIALDIDMSDRMVDVIEEGFDVVIRTGEQHDSRLVSRRLGSCAHVLVGAPSYFERHGLPQRPDDLRRHYCLQHKFPATGKLERWPLLREPGKSDGSDNADNAANMDKADKEEKAAEVEVVLPETMTSNTIETLAYLALQ